MTKQFSSMLLHGGQLIVFITALTAANAARADRCGEVVNRLTDRLTDVVCFESADLTTQGASTTPANNSLPGVPPFAFTPQGDRAVLALSATTGDVEYKGPVPGIQLQARIASDPTGQARFLLRVPNGWNGNLVVAGAAATRSEFNGDFAWSDYVVQKGYAYASQNKGIYNFQVTTESDPLACRLNPASTFWVNFYDVAPEKPFTQWTEYMVEAAKLARRALTAGNGHPPKHTYAVGTSNGGYQVRRAIETAPQLFDGGVDWEGTFVDPASPNLLTDLPPAVLNFPDYLDSGFDPDSTAAKNIRAAGYPPDIVTSDNKSFWAQHWTSYWEVTWCQWQKRLDPTYDTYGNGAANYDYYARLSASDVGKEVAAIATTGEIGRPLITVAGTMDALLPIDHHARAYARKVKTALDERGRGHRKSPVYRLYEVQNGNHIESYKTAWPQLELTGPHARRAFDLLVEHVEQGKTLPADQCIPRGQAINDAPAQPGHCQQLFVP